jgi:SAM-dependent methyltransferase
LLKALLIKTKITALYTKIFPQYIDFLKKELIDCQSILDIGCGPGSPASPFNNGVYSVGVELFLPSLRISKAREIYSDIVYGDLTKVNFTPKSFDCVICSDVIEHLSKDEGLKLIKKMEDIAVKKVLIVTPNGFNEKECLEDENHLQAHKSGWTMKEFSCMNYEVKGALGLKILRGEREELKYKPWAVWQLISDLTQWITYYYPDYAYHILCVKRFNSHTIRGN